MITFLLTPLFYNLSFFNSSRSYEKDRKSILTVSLRKTNVLFKILIHPTAQYDLTTHPSHSTTECIFSVSPDLHFPIISIIIKKQKLHAYLNFIVSYTWISFSHGLMRLHSYVIKLLSRLMKSDSHLNNLFVT